MADGSVPHRPVALGYGARDFQEGRAHDVEGFVAEGRYVVWRHPLCLDLWKDLQSDGPCGSQKKKMSECVYCTQDCGAGLQFNSVVLAQQCVNIVICLPITFSPFCSWHGKAKMLPQFCKLCHLALFCHLWHPSFSLYYYNSVSEWTAKDDGHTRANGNCSWTVVAISLHSALQWKTLSGQKTCYLTVIQPWQHWETLLSWTIPQTYIIASWYRTGKICSKFSQVTRFELLFFP